MVILCVRKKECSDNQSSRTHIHDQVLVSLGPSSRVLRSPSVRSYAHAYPHTSIFSILGLKLKKLA